MGPNGKVYAVYGWYYTSFQGRAKRVQRRRSGWHETDEETVVPPETTLLISPDELSGLSEKDVAKLFRDRYHGGNAAARTRSQIRAHRAIIRALNLPRDGGDFRKVER